MLVLLNIVRVVPFWAWVIAALLAWGAWNGWRAKSTQEAFKAAQASAEVERQKNVASAALEGSRRVLKQQEATDAEIIRRRAAESSAARLRAADERLRARVAELILDRGAGASAPAGGAPATSGGDLLADLYGECRSRLRAVAAEADGYYGAGEACQRSYDALKKP